MSEAAMADGSVGENHPLALQMAVIAFLVNNITIGTLWGSFSVLLVAVEARLGVGRELSTLGVPLVNLTTAACATVVGIVATRYSTRLLMLSGAVSSTAGFVLLAVTHSYPLYLAAYGLLLGPGMAIGVVLPATLVTRWFAAGRGRALGIVCAPIVIAVVPLSTAWVLQTAGLSAAYWMLAAVSAIAIVAGLFVIDHPPGAVDAAHAGPSSTLPGTAINPAALLRSPRFWGLAIGGIASATSSIILTAHMVPMAATWGLSTTLAATLLTIQSLIGIGGTLLFGWIADRIGAIRSLLILMVDGALLWLLLLTQPSFAPAAVLIGLIGLHGAGILPVIGMVLSEAFGRENFSRAYGLYNLANLPFSVLCVPLAAIVAAGTGSYAGAIAGQAMFFMIAACAVILAGGRD